MKRLLVSGNEAIALGAYEAGVKVGVGYPGTPSTEILETLKTYEDVYTEWSVNEKVALEVGIGASLGGVRTLVTMKHVGVNVAADPLFTVSYMGVKGGLVIVSADDPNMHSSQNEQDNRNYAYAAKIPMLEPSDSEEARAFTKLSFEISEKYDTPVFIRPTTRICHAYSIIEIDEKKDKRVEFNKGPFERNLQKYVMIPAFARARHFVVEDRENKIKEDCNSFEINRAEYFGDDSKKAAVGIITSGISYHYVKEAYPEASVLKLGMVYPLPERLIKEFASKVEKLVIVEELEPFFETRIKAMGLEVVGKDVFPITGELSPNHVAKYFGTDTAKNISLKTKLPSRPPALCKGCPHSFVYNTLAKMNVTVAGDIGCYTLGVLPPYSGIDTCVDMGGSITVAQGLELADPTKRFAAIIGDSTFAHSGITGLINAAYNKRTNLIIILDNGTTAMTGMQPNPFSGETIQGIETSPVNYEYLCKAVGVKDDNFIEVNAYKPVEIEAALNKLLAKKELSVLLVRGLCIIYNRKKNRKS